jgi:hypothetical protein
LSIEKPIAGICTFSSRFVNENFEIETGHVLENGQDGEKGGGERAHGARDQRTLPILKHTSFVINNE